MFIRKEILEVPVPQTKSKEQTSARAEVHTIGKVPTLFITFYIRKKPVTTVYVQGDKWLNYIHDSGKFDTRKLVFNRYGCDGIEHRQWQNIPAEDLKVMSQFLNTENTIESCIDVVEAFQRKKDAQEYRARMDSHRIKSAEAREMLRKLPIPKLSEEEVRKIDFRGGSMYWWPEIDSRTNTEIIMGHCVRCGETFEAGSFRVCPYCGNIYDTRLSSKRDFTYEGNIAKMYRHEDTVYCVVYHGERTTSFIKKGRYLKEGFTPQTYYTAYPRDVYIFSEGKMIQFSAWESYSIMGNKCYNGGTEWYFKDKAVWPWGADVLPFNEEMLYGTEFTHSHIADFRRYASQFDEHSTAVTVLKYLKLYQRYPTIENLVTNDFSRWVYKMTVSGSGKSAFNFKGKSLKEITGLNKDERERAISECWTISEFDIYKQYRDKKHKILPKDVLTAVADLSLKDTLKYTDDILKLALYLVKQKSQAQFWIDYMSMAAKLEYDIKDDAVRYPHNLQKAHNQVLQKIEFTENKDLIEKFRLIGNKLQCLTYNNGIFAVAVPKRERELIIEGKYLDHCVGSYGKSHCEGRSIFFVRKADQPDIPWYTLQVDIKKGTKLQLHGYKNDAETPIPQEVKSFVDYWLKNIFRRFDVQTMKFLDKPKAAATA